MSFTKIKNLYIAVNHVVAELGKDGEIQRRNELVENLMMALHSIDHGEFKPDLFDRAQAKLEAQAAKIAELEKDAARWIPVSEEMPKLGTTVFAAYKNSNGKWRTIIAEWVSTKSTESSADSDFGEYDEATDTYYDPEGWYEQVENGADYTAMFVSDGVVSHWCDMPLPPIDAAISLQEGGKG